MLLSPSRGRLGNQRMNMLGLKAVSLCRCFSGDRLRPAREVLNGIARTWRRPTSLRCNQAFSGVADAVAELINASEGLVWSDITLLEFVIILVTFKIGAPHQHRRQVSDETRSVACNVPTERLQLSPHGGPFPTTRFHSSSRCRCSRPIRVPV